MAYGKAPNWNLWGHTMVNHYNDPQVPEGGTCMLWDQGQDGGPYRVMTFEEAKGWFPWKKPLIACGFSRKDREEW